MPAAGCCRYVLHSKSIEGSTFQCSFSRFEINVANSLALSLLVLNDSHLFYLLRIFEEFDYVLLLEFVI